MSSASTTWALGRDGRLVAIADHVPEPDGVLPAAPAAIPDDEPAASSISLPRISAFAEMVEPPPLRRAATPIHPICADKQARIAMIRACHRKLVRAGYFDFAVKP